MVLIFSTYLFHLIIPVGNFLIGPHFVFQILFIDKLFGELILVLGKLNLAIEYFS